LRPFTPTPTPPVIGLLRSCRPAAVLGRIRAIVVNSVKCVAVWAWPHVGHKVLKHVPSLANVDTTAAVVGICRICRPVTAPKHMKPCSVISMYGVASCVSVLGRPLCRLLVTPATATLDAVFQRCGGHKFLCSAVAHNHPHYMRMAVCKAPVRPTRNHRKTPEAFACEVKSQWDGFSIVPQDISHWLAGHVAAFMTRDLSYWSRLTTTALAKHGDSIARKRHPKVWLSGLARVETYTP
jgi:hypothetical protein